MLHHSEHILAINPPVFDFAFFDLWAKPLGLLYLLQDLREHGAEVTLIDCIHEARTTPRSFGRYRIARREIAKPDAYRGVRRRYYHFGLEGAAFRERLGECRKPTRVLVTSMMTYWYPGVFWCIEQIRRVFPHVPITLGGVYARLCPAHAARSGADIVQSEPITVRASHPAFDLYENPEYGVSMTSVGCPLNCQYCASNALYPRFRQRPVDEVTAELAALAAIPTIRDVAFYDDALLWNTQDHFHAIAARVANMGLGLRYHTPNGLHAGLIDTRCAEQLSGMGFRTLRLSLESGDPAIQAMGSWKVTRDTYQRAVRALSAAGYAPADLETYLLIGLPDQSVASIREAIRFVQDCGATVKTAQYSPVPGTVLFEQACTGFPDIAHEPLLHNNTVYATHVARQLAPDTLQKLKDLARGAP